MTAPYVVGRSDSISWAIAASLKTVVHDVDEPGRPGSGDVVIVIGIDPLVEPTHVSALSPAEWRRFAEQPMRQALDVLQRSYRSMRQDGGRIVLVLPSIGMTGGPHLVACATALEGIRAMAKSAARQWARENVIVNTITAPLHLFAPKLSGSAAHVTAAALQDDDKLIESIVETTRFLLKRGVSGLVGETVIVDGGALMLP
ncbi:ABC transporter permease [Mycobacterium colombiense]|uniref:ABC transporter permease n=1 Tax=Mycobacterium colombiense TaxID=339268 RepID=A0A329KUS4_9MYCO|nr:SDR family oxidoreductase [Mycobacterium colombiense]RAU99327.1 ABC transporter permease [Mycobacterium colombiense]